MYVLAGEPGVPSRAPQAGPSEPGASIRSIAVLPLDNLGSPEQEYVADGVTDALIESQALADSNPWAPRTTTRRRPSRSSLDC